MEVWVLYETNDDLEQGPLINECYGVFINKEEALDKFEELGLLTSTKYGARIKYKISK